MICSARVRDDLEDIWLKSQFSIAVTWNKFGGRGALQGVISGLTQDDSIYSMSATSEYEPVARQVSTIPIFIKQTHRTH